MSQQQIEIILDAMDQPEKLYYWENEFINSLTRLDPNKPLSNWQNEILNNIAKKIMD